MFLKNIANLSKKEISLFFINQVIVGLKMLQKMTKL